MTTKSIIFLVVLFSISCSSLAADFLQITVDTETNQLIDSFGRVRFFHGTNSVQKGYPWIPYDQLTLPRIQFMQEMGFNAIRLGTMWPGVEPQRGSWNTTYLDEIGRMIDTLAEYGMYVFLDCHQDVYNPKLCGEGFPDWAVNTNGQTPTPFAEPIHPVMSINSTTGIPKNCGDYAWTSYYLTDAVGKSFQGLYDNYNGLQDEFGNFWKTVAKTFANKTSVLGYELINEPWCGDIYEDVELLLPAQADIKNLQPMYDNLVKAIREVDQKHLIFYEPVTWVLTPTGFTHVPGGDEFQNLSVMSWHYYCWIFDPNSMNWEKWAFCEDIEGPDMFYQRTIDIDRLGGASFLTEWGANCDGETENGTTECNWVMDQADKYQQSWTFWDITLLFNGDIPKIKTAKLLSRPYPQAVAGVPTHFDFNAETSEFNLIYNVKAAIFVPTTIYLNEKLTYPNGYVLTVTPENAVAVLRDTNKIFLFNREQVVDGQEISVKITKM